MTFTYDEPSHRRSLAEKLRGFRFGMSPNSTSQSLSNTGSQASQGLKGSKAREGHKCHHAPCPSQRCHHPSPCSPFERKFSFGKKFPNYYNYSRPAPGSNPDLKFLLKKSGVIDSTSDDTSRGSNSANAAGMSPEAREKAFDEILHGAFDKDDSPRLAHNRGKHEENWGEIGGRAAPRTVRSPLSDASLQSLNEKTQDPAELLAPHSVKSAAQADASLNDPVHVGLLTAHAQNPSESILHSSPGLWKLFEMVQNNTKKTQQLSEILRSYLNPPFDSNDGTALTGRPRTDKGPRKTFIKPTRHLHVKYPEPLVAAAGGDSPDPPNDRKGFLRGHMVDDHASSDPSTSRNDNAEGDISALSEPSPSISRPGSGVASVQGHSSVLSSTQDANLVGPDCNHDAPSFGSSDLAPYPFSFERQTSEPGCTRLSHCQNPLKRPIDDVAGADAKSVDPHNQSQQHHRDHDCGCSSMKEQVSSPRSQCPGYSEYHQCSKRQKRPFQPVTEGYDDLVRNHENHPLPALETYLRQEKSSPGNGKQGPCWLGETLQTLPEAYAPESFCGFHGQERNHAPELEGAIPGVLTGFTNGGLNSMDYPVPQQGHDSYGQYNAESFDFVPTTVPPTPYLAPRCCPRCVS